MAKSASRSASSEHRERLRLFSWRGKVRRARIDQCAPQPLSHYPSLTSNQSTRQRAVQRPRPSPATARLLRKKLTERLVCASQNAVAHPMHSASTPNLGTTTSSTPPRTVRAAAINLDSAGTPTSSPRAPVLRRRTQHGMHAASRPARYSSSARGSSRVSRLLDAPTMWTWAPASQVALWQLRAGLGVRQEDFRGWSRRDLAAARMRRWTKDVFDRGLLLYLRLAETAPDPIAPVQDGAAHRGMEEFDCCTTRMMANAARAIAYGMGSIRQRPAAAARSTTTPVDLSLHPRVLDRARFLQPQCLPYRRTDPVESQPAGAPSARSAASAGGDGGCRAQQRRQGLAAFPLTARRHQPPAEPDRLAARQGHAPARVSPSSPVPFRRTRLEAIRRRAQQDQLDHGPATASRRRPRITSLRRCASHRRLRQRCRPAVPPRSMRR